VSQSVLHWLATLHETCSYQKVTTHRQCGAAHSGPMSRMALNGLDEVSCVVRSCLHSWAQPSSTVAAPGIMPGVPAVSLKQGVDWPAGSFD
jgi:hypothetical protein